MSSLLFEKHGFVATLTINRPETRNILGEEGDGALFAEAAARINADRELRCAVITGAGTAFSAGGNLKAMREKSGVFAGRVLENYRADIHTIIRSLWNLEVPLIAAVNGAAIGLGNGVACTADIRIASKFASFGASFLKIGLVPGDGSAWMLPRLIGPARAAELFFTGEIIDAATALEWGLVSRLVPPELLMEEAHGLAAEIAHQPPGVLRLTKKLLREAAGAKLETILEMSGSFQASAHASEDHAEALAAFFEKREPNFKGK
jgi:enoyl-CoA hydratase/carnithine racemase